MNELEKNGVYYWFDKNHETRTFGIYKVQIEELKQTNRYPSRFTIRIIFKEKFCESKKPRNMNTGLVGILLTNISLDVLSSHFNGEFFDSLGDIFKYVFLEDTNPPSIDHYVFMNFFRDL